MARLEPSLRKQSILDAAISLAEKEGFSNIRRDDVARAANCSNGLVNSYFGNIKQLRRAVMRSAIKNENLCIILQGLLVNDKLALKAPAELRQRAKSSL